MNTIKSIFITSLLLVGVVSATSTEVEHRVEYTRTLNSMAAVLMNRYGNVLNSDAIDSVYPEKVTGLKITKTDLIKLDLNEYSFNVQSKLTYIQDDSMQAKALDETFIFHIGPLGQATITSKVRNKETSIEVMSLAKFNHDHYQTREFAYTWLAYLDGVVLDNSIKDKPWFDNAEYTVKIGSKEIQGSILSTLAARKAYLFKGGHLLRELEVKVKALEGSDDVFILDLIIDWQGVNAAGKSVLAKIHQTITYQLEEHNQWNVISIEEEHLLPDIAPWQNLLC
ncbi:MAG: hypothetical protein COA90_00845 [Gammaproteobacteria bacterium]|nr:MAG: hypothetical protein COA90_00845 [Gammaproteobacteria bacterium]